MFFERYDMYILIGFLSVIALMEIIDTVRSMKTETEKEEEFEKCRKEVVQSLDDVRELFFTMSEAKALKCMDFNWKCLNEIQHAKTTDTLLAIHNKMITFITHTDSNGVTHESPQRDDRRYADDLT